MLLKQKMYGYPDMFILAFRTAPFLCMLFLAHNVLNALLPTIQIFVTAMFVDRTIGMFRGTVGMRDVYVPVAVFAGIMVYTSLSAVFLNRINCLRDIRLREKLMPSIITVVAELEYRHIENSDSLDLINRVFPEFDKKAAAMYTGILNLVSLTVFTFGIMTTLFSQIWWVGLIMATSSVPLVFIASKAGKETYQANREVTKYRRRANYLSEVLINREYVEERSIFEYSEELNRMYNEHYEYARKFNIKVYVRNFIKYKAGSLVATIYPIMAMLLLLKPTLSGELEISMFIALVTAIFGLSDRLSQGIDKEFTALVSHREYLRDLTKLMALEKEKDSTAVPCKSMYFNKIEFIDVRFKYPGTEKMILDGVSFVIERSKNYSFVGENGAGKTTITKLITGLYSNYDGKILVDGRSLREFTQSEIKGLTSVVYQDFAKYYITLYDNIALGGLHQCKTAEVSSVINTMGLSEMARMLKNGVDTPLGKITEGGVDVSGGEWQRIAIARSMMSKSPLRILDEPTAALDPISESTVYRNFKNISSKDKNKTSIFISHRLGSTKLADMIFVLSDGKIVEEGSHKTLMAKKGVYAGMFDVQAKWYNNEAGFND